MKKRNRIIFTALATVTLFLLSWDNLPLFVSVPEVMPSSLNRESIPRPNQHPQTTLTAARTDKPDDKDRLGMFEMANKDEVETMIYHGGAVMDGITNVYLIFWQPTRNVAIGYNNLIMRYFQDVGSSRLYKNEAQYPNASGKVPIGSVLVGVFNETRPYPHRPVVTDSDLQNEIAQVQQAKGWVSNRHNIFFVFLESKANFCTDLDLKTCTSTGFCAYHGFNGSLLYVPMEYIADNNCAPLPASPNHNVADMTINVASHELLEAVASPYAKGWFNDKTNDEISDACGGVFGPLKANGANEIWNGHPYLVQEEWSNAINGCTQ